MVTGTLHQLMPVIVLVYITPRFFAPVALQKAVNTFLESFWLSLRFFFVIYLLDDCGAMVRAPFTPELLDELACIRIKASALFLLATFALSTLDSFTLFFVRTMITLYPRFTSSFFSFLATCRFSLYSGRCVTHPEVPPVTFAFLTEEPGPFGSVAPMARV